MSDLIERLCSEAHDFSFFKSVMLLEDYFRKNSGIANPIDAGKIRFLPDESIAFPPNDISAIKEQEGTISFILSFMGLVGVDVVTLGRIGRVRRGNAGAVTAVTGGHDITVIRVDRHHGR